MGGNASIAMAGEPGAFWSTVVRRVRNPRHVNYVRPQTLQLQPARSSLSRTLFDTVVGSEKQRVFG